MCECWFTFPFIWCLYRALSQTHTIFQIHYMNSICAQANSRLWCNVSAAVRHITRKAASILSPLAVAMRSVLIRSLILLMFVRQSTHETWRSASSSLKSYSVLWLRCNTECSQNVITFPFKAHLRQNQSANKKRDRKVDSDNRELECLGMLSM